jgi:hypothetical protein
MNIYCVKGVAAYHELRAVCATVPRGTVAHTYACTREFMIRCHTLHTIYVHVLQIVLPVNYLGTWVLPEDDMWYVETCRSYESMEVF